MDKSTLFNVQAQYDAELADGKQRFIFGFDYDRTTPDTKGTIYGRNESNDLISETGAYVQSQTAISPKFDLTLALRGDFNNLQDEFVLSPRVAAVFKPTPEHSFRATYNRAFTSPGNTENFLDILARRRDEILPFDIRGRGSARGFTFGRNPAFASFAGSDLVAYSINPATLGAPQPIGLPLDATYATIFAGLNDLATNNPDAIRAVLPAPLNGLPDAQLQGLIALFDPSITVVNGFSKGTLGLLNTSTLGIDPIADVTDIKPLKRNTTDTFEFGYKGLIQNRVLFSIDTYFTHKEDFVGPLLMETPFVFTPTLTTDLATALTAGITNNATLAATLGAVGFTPEQVAQLIVQLAGQLQPGTPLSDPSVPVAIVAPNENAPQLGQAPELLLAYR
ncbi:MAG: TonB-dependent receptor domain-containing protein, partial [bacterium]